MGNKKDEKKPKINPARASRSLTFAMDRNSHDFKRKFWKIKQLSGSILCEEKEDQKIERIDDYNEFYDAVQKFAFNSKILVETDEQYKQFAYFDSHGKATNFHHTWRALTERQADEKDVADVRFKGEAGLCWHRLDFDRPKPREVNLDKPFEGFNCPTWEKMLTKGSNTNAVLAFLGSGFDPNSKSNQYCYMYGSGRNGKGSTMRFLRKLFGDAFASEDAESKKNQFWTHGLIGKRWLAFPDIDNIDFVKTGLFRRITGGDPVRVEPKGLSAFTVQLDMKVIMAANDRIEITGTYANTRRAIYVEFAPTEDKDIDPNFEKKLWDERAEFIGLCMSMYEALCPNHEEIPVDQEDLQTIVERGETDLQAFFDEHFVLEAGAELGNAVPGQLFNRRWKIEGGDEKTKVRDFRKWLENRQGVSNRKKGSDVNRRLVWEGVKLKNEAEMGASQF